MEGGRLQGFGGTRGPRGCDSAPMAAASESDPAVVWDPTSGCWSIRNQRPCPRLPVPAVRSWMAIAPSVRGSKQQRSSPASPTRALPAGAAVLAPGGAGASGEAPVSVAGGLRGGWARRCAPSSRGLPCASSRQGGCRPGAVTGHFPAGQVPSKMRGRCRDPGCLAAAGLAASSSSFSAEVASLRAQPAQPRPLPRP